ncbi:GNAT family N-acetyltransferase [Spirosoma rigui]|uniref:GNAT family N-acetyltransferase n=1 Tax=Spirosoma rigui TaxID=564064 RepID=UPI0009B02E73|nr:GNAT family N-acetyltransferase [Spirosoma rigui]
MNETVRWFKIPAPALEALIDRDLERASQQVGISLSPFFTTDEAIRRWHMRLDQARQDERALDWIAQVVTHHNRVIGHAGFHGPPDETGMVEVAYTVEPALRGRGYAKVMLAGLLERARQEPAVRTVRATIRPDNTASLATIRPFPFAHKGEQWDDVDGLELIFEIDVK